MGFGSGLTWGCIEIAWYPENPQDKYGKYIDVFSWRAVTRMVMEPALIMGIGMGVFTFSQCNFETYRKVRDPWNAVYAGAITGFLAGFAFRRRFDKATFFAIATGAGMGFADIAGALFDYEGDPKDTVLRPKKYVESDELKAMKDLYPKFKDL